MLSNCWLLFWTQLNILELWNLFCFFSYLKSTTDLITGQHTLHVWDVEIQKSPGLMTGRNQKLSSQFNCIDHVACFAHSRKCDCGRVYSIEKKCSTNFRKIQWSFGQINPEQHIISIRPFAWEPLVREKQFRELCVESKSSNNWSCSNR